jgi:hypothetical protein
MKWRRWLVVTGVILGAVLLAFPLRGAVNQLIVIPLAYLLYTLQLLYLSLPQLIWWLAVVALVLIVLGASLLDEIKLTYRPIEPDRIKRGRVEHLARVMRKSQRGTYSKWLVANTLGRLAYQILLQRDHGKPRAVFAPLEGEDWNPLPGVRDYLEEGLHGSYTELPSHGWVPLVRREPIVLDYDLTQVIAFLESKVGDGSAPDRH